MMGMIENMLSPLVDKVDIVLFGQAAQSGSLPDLTEKTIFSPIPRIAWFLTAFLIISIVNLDCMSLYNIYWDWTHLQHLFMSTKQLTKHYC
jgi:hypothetical protein